MESNTAIKHLEAYIQTIIRKWRIYWRIEKEYTILSDDRIQSALEQIELYKVGKGRLNF